MPYSSFLQRLKKGNISSGITSSLETTHNGQLSSSPNKKRLDFASSYPSPPSHSMSPYFDYPNLIVSTFVSIEWFRGMRKKPNLS